VRQELKAYGGGLEEKKEIVALSKCDAVDEETLTQRLEALKKAAKKTPLVLSAVSGAGVRDALFALARDIGSADKREAAESSDAHEPWRP